MKLVILRADLRDTNAQLKRIADLLETWLGMKAVPDNVDEPPTVQFIDAEAEAVREAETWLKSQEKL